MSNTPVKFGPSLGKFLGPPLENTIVVLGEGHEQARHLVHDDDGHLVGEEQKQVLGVDVLDLLPSLHVLVRGDGLPQRLKPTDEERLVVEQRQREPTVELLPLDLTVLLGGLLLGLCLRLDLPQPQPPVLRPPRRLPPPLHLSACFSRSSVLHRR